MKQKPNPACGCWAGSPPQKLCPCPCWKHTEGSSGHQQAIPAAQALGDLCDEMQDTQ